MSSNTHHAYQTRQPAIKVTIQQPHNKVTCTPSPLHVCQPETIAFTLDGPHSGITFTGFTADITEFPTASIQIENDGQLLKVSDLYRSAGDFNYTLYFDGPGGPFKSDPQIVNNPKIAQDV